MVRQHHRPCGPSAWKLGPEFRREETIDEVRRLRQRESTQRKVLRALRRAACARVERGTYAGRGDGSLKPGRHVIYKKGTPMTNLYLALLDRMGVQPERLGDCTGKLERLAEL